MLISLSRNQLLLLRLRAQQLIPQQVGTITNVARIVKDICSI